MPIELTVLHSRIEARVNAITESCRDWPCRKGCDSCCRRLAAPPRLDRAEWDLLRQGLARLTPSVVYDIGTRLGSWPACPMLDVTDRVCLVYEHRPTACRTYGFYRERDKGLYCRRIEAMVERGECDAVVWGNVESVDAELGAGRPLAEWWAELD